MLFDPHGSTLDQIHLSAYLVIGKRRKVWKSWMFVWHENFLPRSGFLLVSSFPETSPSQSSRHQDPEEGIANLEHRLTRPLQGNLRDGLLH